MKLWDELDERRMTYVLGMLVRLFYWGDGETGEWPLHEQELRKATILYMSGTGGASQVARHVICHLVRLHGSGTTHAPPRPYAPICLPARAPP